MLSWGLVLSALIQFLLVATVVYFALIVPMNYLKKVAFAKKKAGEEKPADQPPTELELLDRDPRPAAGAAAPRAARASRPPTSSCSTEIRDLLRAQQAPPRDSAQ